MSEIKLTIDEVIEHCGRQVTIWERQFTRGKLEKEDISNNFVKQYWEHRQVAEWLKELKEYKQLEERGLLIRKTFELGGKAYIHQFNKEGVLVPVQCRVVAIGDDFVRILIHDGKQLNIPKNSKGLFLTEELARASLVKKEGGIE